MSTHPFSVNNGPRGAKPSPLPGNPAGLDLATLVFRYEEAQRQISQREASHPDGRYETLRSNKRLEIVNLLKLYSSAHHLAPYRRVVAFHDAIKGGDLAAVKRFVEQGVVTSDSLKAYFSAPQENVHILRFLLSKGARLTDAAFYQAVQIKWQQSARLMIEHDRSGLILEKSIKTAAFACIELYKLDLDSFLGLGECGWSGWPDHGTSHLENLCEIFDPEYQRDIWEHALVAALKQPKEEARAAILKKGAQGDRIVWNRSDFHNEWMCNFLTPDFAELCRDFGIQMPLFYRFPRYFPANDDWDNAVDYMLDMSPISAPLVEHLGLKSVHKIQYACDCSDRGLLRELIEAHGDILKPEYYLLEQLVSFGSRDLVEFLVGEFKADVNQNEGMPLAIAAQEGYVDVLQCLISEGADVNAYQGAALSEAARMSNAEVVKFLLAKGANPRAHRSKAVYDCMMQADSIKLSAALRAAKLLIDAGASPPLVFPRPPSGEATPAFLYVRFMAEIAAPSSPLYLRTLEPRLTNSDIDFNFSGYHRQSVFGFASSCAAVAARLSATPENPQLFISLFKNGMAKVLDQGVGTFSNLRDSTNANSDLFQDLNDPVEAVLWDVVVPILTLTWKKCSHQEEQRIVEKATCLRRVVGFELFAGRSIAEILRFNQLWHRPDKQLPSSAKPLRGLATWYPLIPHINLGNGLTMEALTSDDALFVEGTVMHNCLRSGGYSSSCLLGRVHILSIRREGKPVANAVVQDVSPRTGEFSSPDGRSLSVTQLRGSGNAEVGQSVKDSFESFKAMVRQGKCIVNDRCGETNESRQARENRGVTLLESLTGLKIGQYPTDAVRHYQNVVSVTQTGKAAYGQPIKIGLLNQELLDRIVAACRNELGWPTPQSAADMSQP